MHALAGLALAVLLAGCADPSGDPATGTGIVQGSAMVSPTCPVERDPPEPGCAPRPYEGQLAVLTEDGGRVVQRFSTHSDGTFEVDVAAGTYTIASPPEAPMLPHCSSPTFVVVAHATILVEVDCDSGIR